MRFIPCSKGPSCSKDFCNRFHGTEIRKSSKPCRFGGQCRTKTFCPFQHPQEAVKPGDVIWRFVTPGATWVLPRNKSGLPEFDPIPWPAPKAAPKPKEPEGPPMPLDSITHMLSEFLGNKECQNLRLVNKACKESAGYVPIQSLEMKWTTELPKSSLTYLSKLTFLEPHPPLEHMPPRLVRIAEIQRLRELSVPTTHLQAVLESLPKSSLESLEKISIVHPSAATEFKLPESMSRLISLDKLELGVPRYGFRVDLEVLPKISRLKRLKLQYVTPSDLKVFQHTRLEKVQIIRAGIPLLNAILSIPTLQKLKIYNVGYLGNPSGQEVVVPHTLKLNSIRISHPNMRLGQFIRDVARAAPDLEKLCLDSMTDSDHMTDFSQFKKLKHLDLGNNSWIDTNILCEIVKTLPLTLEQLYLHGATVLSPLSIKNIPKLRSLGLNGVRYDPEALTDLLQGFVINGTPLEQIGFTSQSMTLDSLDRCFALLTQIPTMKRIFFYISGCYMSSNLTNAPVRACFKKHFADKTVVLHSAHDVVPKNKIIKL